MRKSAEIAQELIALYLDVLARLPNLRYILFSCASDQMTPPWIDHEITEAQKRGDNVIVEKIQGVDTAREGFLVLMLGLFRTSLELSSDSGQISRLMNLDTSLAEGVAQMKLTGVRPRPLS